MAVEAPPSRYRVVERNRRLQVVDTWHDGRPPATPKTPIPKNLGEERRPLDRAPPRRDEAWKAPRKRSARAMPMGQDVEGRTLLRTASWWDAKGPRTVTLRSDREPAVQSIGALALVAAVLLAVLCFAMPWLLIPAVIALGNSRLRTRARLGMAGLVDSLAQEAADSGG
ncbi:hypothetical protein [Stakelama tenebrarum]|uniref:Uncharacterized protein n=1 Tax=Stakelama tenebrarum TaxID=2711215 RepID=A0A6G6Y0Y4_9SPHN|nr:hypothetical protein [Sphingosinithalassobacter tenebrarum]QIG78491.1 hypothetical protein G5C33_00895 [Sphingosinithalassobacter tenebrarum]